MARKKHFLTIASVVLSASLCTGAHAAKSNDEGFWNEGKESNQKLKSLSGKTTSETNLPKTEDKKEFSTCRQFFKNNQLPLISDNALMSMRAIDICYSDFAVLYSGVTKSPILCAQKITPKDLREGSDTIPSLAYAPEKRIPTQYRSYPRSFESTRHGVVQCADRTMASSSKSMSERYLTSNLFISTKSIERSHWSTVNQGIRDYVKTTRSEVYVLTGATFNPDFFVVGPDNLWQPQAFYKIVEDVTLNKTFGYWLDNTPDARGFVKIDKMEIEQKTGLIF